MYNGAETNIISNDDAVYNHKPVRSRQISKTIVDSKQSLRTLVVMLAVLFIGFLAIIRYTNANNNSQGESVTSESGGLYCGLRIYDNGSDKPIGLQMSLYNMSGHRMALKFTKSPMLDFVVQRPVHLLFSTVPMEVWRYSTKHNRYAFTTDEAVMEIMPGEEKVVHGEWDRTDNEGDPIGADKYVITGFINIDGASRALNVERG